MENRICFSGKEQSVIRESASISQRIIKILQERKFQCFENNKSKGKLYKQKMFLRNETIS